MALKLQCARCKEIVVADFAVAAGGGAIEVTCPACGESYEVPATRGAAAAAAPASVVVRSTTGTEAAAGTVAASGTATGTAAASVAGTVSVAGTATGTGAATGAAAVRPAPAPGAPAMSCPKCDDHQPEALACRTCGLLAANFDTARERLRQADASASAEVVAAWRAVEESWSDDDAHERFLQVAAARGALAYAARRYREATRARPDDGRATAQLARLTRMAEATLTASATARAPKARSPYRGLMAMLLAMMVLAGLGAAYTMLVSRQAEADAEEQGRRTPVEPSKRPRPLDRR